MWLTIPKNLSYTLFWLINRQRVCFWLQNHKPFGGIWFSQIPFAKSFFNDIKNSLREGYLTVKIPQRVYDFATRHILSGFMRQKGYTKGAFGLMNPIRIFDCAHKRIWGFIILLWVFSVQRTISNHSIFQYYVGDAESF